MAAKSSGRSRARAIPDDEQMDKITAWRKREHVAGLREQIARRLNALEKLSVLLIRDMEDDLQEIAKMGG